MTKGKILGDIHQIDKDVELCRTTNERISNQAAQLLIENQIPFTRGWIKVPFFLREKYRGAHQIYVIRTIYNNFGAGVQTEIEDGQTLTYDENGEMVVSGFDKEMPYLSYIVGTVSDHTLTLHGKEISLRDLCGRNSKVEFSCEHKGF